MVSECRWDIYLCIYIYTCVSFPLGNSVQELLGPNALYIYIYIISNTSTFTSLIIYIYIYHSFIVHIVQEVRHQQ